MILKGWVFALFIPPFIMLCYMLSGCELLSIYRYYVTIQDFWDDCLLIYTYKTAATLVFWLLGDVTLVHYMETCKMLREWKAKKDAKKHD